MDVSDRMHPAAVARTLLGLALLARPESILDAAAGERVDRRWSLAARVLGARHLVEVVAVNVEPEPGFAVFGAGVDAIHAVTAAAFALADSKRRRILTINALAATAFALAGAHHARVLARER